jgi:GNAT superfamily N-acetyltransferase
VIRRADVTDANMVADVWLESFAAGLPTVRRAHSEAEVRKWVRSQLIPETECWLAVRDDTVVGVMALDGDELSQLYVAPQWWGRGVGTELLMLAQGSREALELWTFQVNERAQQFYNRHGFREVERTDGSRNEEREPDIRYRWESDR